MTRAMKNIAAQHMIYMTAIEMSTDEEEKQRLKEMADKLANHPAVAAYGKYIEGLRYLSGEIKEVSTDNLVQGTKILVLNGGNAGVTAN